MKDVLYVPGGFDVLHSDHKKYIKKCFNAVSKQFKIDKVIIGLISDNDLQVKGKERPIFSYEWRKEDLIDWAKNNFKDVEFEVEKLNTSCFKKFPQNDKILKRIITISSEHKNSLPIKELCDWHPKVFFINPTGKKHTSDIPDRIEKMKKLSGCFIRKVSAIVVRSGDIVKITKNGTSKKCLENNCDKYKDLIAKYKRTGKKMPCDFPHAEIRALGYSKNGDDMVIASSPCMQCAEGIVSKKIRRVVYFEEYHDFTPIVFLKKHGVACRKAGVNK